VQFFQWVDECLLLQCERALFLDGSGRPDHEVDQRAQKRGHETQKPRQADEALRVGPPLRITQDEECQRDPQHRQIDDQSANTQDQGSARIGNDWMHDGSIWGGLVWRHEAAMRSAPAAQNG